MGSSLRVMMTFKLVFRENVLMMVRHHGLSRVDGQETMREAVLNGRRVLWISVNADLPSGVADVIFHLIVVITSDGRLKKVVSALILLGQQRVGDVLCTFLLIDVLRELLVSLTAGIVMIRVSKISLFRVEQLSLGIMREPHEISQRIMRRGTMDRTIVANSVLLVSPVEQHLAQVIGQLLDGVSGCWILVAHAIDHVKPPVAARLDPAGPKPLVGNPPPKPPPPIGPPLSGILGALMPSEDSLTGSLMGILAALMNSPIIALRLATCLGSTWSPPIPRGVTGSPPARSNLALLPAKLLPPRPLRSRSLSWASWSSGSSHSPFLKMGAVMMEVTLGGARPRQTRPPRGYTSTSQLPIALFFLGYFVAIMYRRSDDDDDDSDGVPM